MMLRSVYVYIYVMTTPKHQPIKINDYTVKNQKYQYVGTLPSRKIM